MSVADLGKVKRGDLVVVHSQARSAHGLFVVLAVGKAWFEAVPADMQSSMQRNKLQPSDIAIHIAGAGGPTLTAASGTMDLDTPPAAKVEATAPVEEVAPPTFVRIRVTAPQPSYRLDFRGKDSVEYTPVAHGRDRLGQPTADFIVEKAHAALLARADVALELVEDPAKGSG
jgi:hypothetical protein